MPELPVLLLKLWVALTAGSAVVLVLQIALQAAAARARSVLRPPAGPSRDIPSAEAAGPRRPRPAEGTR